jgi:hypothetical protein
VDSGVTLALGVSVPLDGAIVDARSGSRRLQVEQLGVKGDVRQAIVRVTPGSVEQIVTVSIRDGSDVYRTIDAAPAGARNSGLRILRSRASSTGLSLRLEAPAGTTHLVRLRSPRQLGVLPDGVRRLSSSEGDPALEISFAGSGADYVRRDLVLPLAGR